MIDTVVGAKSIVIIYSIVDIEKANNLKPYDYFGCLFSGMSKQLDDLLPGSLKIPVNCRKPSKNEVK